MLAETSRVHSGRNTNPVKLKPLTSIALVNPSSHPPRSYFLPCQLTRRISRLDNEARSSGRIENPDPSAPAQLAAYSLEPLHARSMIAILSSSRSTVRGCTSTTALRAKDICRQEARLLVHVQSCCRQVGCHQSRTACRLGGTWDYKKPKDQYCIRGEESEGYDVLFFRNERQSGSSFAL